MSSRMDVITLTVFALSFLAVLSFDLGAWGERIVGTLAATAALWFLRLAMRAASLGAARWAWEQAQALHDKQFAEQQEWRNGLGRRLDKIDGDNKHLDKCLDEVKQDVAFLKGVARARQDSRQP